MVFFANHPHYHEEVFHLIEPLIKLHSVEIAIIGMLDSSAIRTQQYALNMLQLFLAACKRQ